MIVTNNPQKFLFINEKLFNTSLESWLISHVLKLMHQTDKGAKVGDFLLFLQQENQLSSTYQYGMISDLSRSSEIRFVKQLFVIKTVSKQLIDLLIVQCNN